MAEKEMLIKETFDHSGMFDFKSFYSFAHSWFVDENYGVSEDKYSEKVAGNVRDIYIQWTASKQLSDYFKVELKIEIEVKGLSDVEVEVDGERKKTNKGKIKVDVKGLIVTDPSSKWDTSAFNRFMRDVYNKYVIPARIKNMQAAVISGVGNFKEEMKAYLELTGQR
jgi:hypothetical protein